MNVRIISWNVRGLNEQDKRLRVRNLIRKWGPDVVCLQKTKIGLINRAVIRSLWGGVLSPFLTPKNLVFRSPFLIEQ